MTKRGGWPPTGFGERLRQLREGAGLSQRELAERAGCNPFTVAKTERGEQEPAWPLVLALGRALGVEVGAFVNDSPQQPGTQPERRRGRPRKVEAGAGVDGKESAPADPAPLPPPARASLAPARPAGREAPTGRPGRPGSARQAGAAPERRRGRKGKPPADTGGA